ncbi:hypothetical protein [Methanocaldococcus fervens]|uniref:Flagellin n=1 Tax=Methanocaldococcus fervens (strain DSM 4213 / JCM 15782 / AG86) TaxID=573064 RepID=C7P903_METFA|nr:hypothetical protein [Methanocaldococcus fervens]ACV25035.1 hypothetical protein Mefer_1226 [Methanocaldococcus fervens AG86]
MFKTEKGQISLDFILAMMFLMLVSLFLYNVELKFSNSTTDALIVDRMHSIADTFENYAILAYTTNKTIFYILKPIGSIDYEITISNKKINVYGDTVVTFTPNENGVTIGGYVSPSNVDIGNNIVITTNINGRTVYVSKKIEVNVS